MNEACSISCRHYDLRTMICTLLSVHFDLHTIVYEHERV